MKKVMRVLRKKKWFESKRWITMFFLCFMAYTVYGQQNTVTGNVTTEDGVTLPGVNVVIKGTSTGTITDATGNFSINAPDNDAFLVISFVGYKTKEIQIGSQSNINVVLALSNEILDEIIVVGYGEQIKKSITGSVSQIGNDDFVNQPYSNAATALSGRIAGAQVTQNSGEPGSDGATIRIRGVGTTNNANPLVLVDGIPSSLDDVAPANIDKVTVLKDASASAIYGARAANGVILITTKRGKGELGVTNFSLSSYTGWQTAKNIPEVLNSYDFARLQNEAFLISGIMPDNLPWSETELEGFKTGSDPYLYPNTNWMDEIMQTAPMQDYRVEVSSNKEDINYNISGEFFNQEGLIINTNSKRYNFRINLDTKLTSKFNVGTSLAYTKKENNGLFSIREGYGAATDIIRAALSFAPTVPVKNMDGTWGFPFRDQIQEVDYFINPVRFTELQKDNTKNNTDRIIGSFYGEYEFIDNLKLKYTFGTNMYFLGQHDFQPVYASINPVTGEDVGSQASNPIAKLNKVNSNSKYMTHTLTLSYNKLLFDNHMISTLAGYSREHSRYDMVTAYVEDFPSNVVQSLNQGSLNPSVNEIAYQFALESIFGRLTYAFKNKYLFEANLRYDGTSRFLKNTRHGLFPSFSVGWVLSEENFMSELLFVDQMKIRTSWGQLGNEQVSGYNPAVQQISAGQNYIFGDAIAPGAASTALANQDLVWETSTMTNFALDMILFKKFELTTEYFIKTTSDLLWQVTIPCFAGDLEPPYKNIGVIENKGWESVFSYNDKIGDFGFGVNLNFTHINNQVKDLKGDELIQDQFIIREGDPINSIYGYKVTGIFNDTEEINASATQNPTPLPGTVKYLDQNDDGVIDETDRVIIGNTIPKKFYGFSIRMDYKGFDFSAFFSGVKGKDVYMQRFGRIGFGGAENILVEFLDYWSPDRPDSDIWSIGTRSVLNRNNINSWWVKDVSYLRLKSMELGYTLPANLSERLNLKYVRVFMAGQNLFTWTDFIGMEVETMSNISSINEYPMARTITVGLNINF